MASTKRKRDDAQIWNNPEGREGSIVVYYPDEERAEIIHIEGTPDLRRMRCELIAGLNRRNPDHNVHYDVVEDLNGIARQHGDMYNIVAVYITELDERAMDVDEGGPAGNIPIEGSIETHALDDINAVGSVVITMFKDIYAEDTGEFLYRANVGLSREAAREIKDFLVEPDDFSDEEDESPYAKRMRQEQEAQQVVYPRTFDDGRIVAHHAGKLDDTTTGATGYLSADADISIVGDEHRRIVLPIYFLPTAFEVTRGRFDLARTKNIAVYMYRDIATTIRDVMVMFGIAEADTFIYGRHNTHLIALPRDRMGPAVGDFNDWMMERSFLDVLVPIPAEPQLLSKYNALYVMTPAYHAWLETGAAYRTDQGQAYAAAMSRRGRRDEGSSA